jgi:hypothetical protein
MLQLNLRPEDRDLLVEIVEEYLSDLRVEIGDTGDFDYRHKLKEKEKAIGEILDALHQPRQTIETSLAGRPAEPI